jgi:hypothetical protein
MQEIMSITEAQARRALRHADIPWDQGVDDPREEAWVVHDHRGLLGGLAAAFSIGCRSLRRVEDFFADLGLGAQRQGPVPETFLRRTRPGGPEDPTEDPTQSSAVRPVGPRRGPS